MTFQYDIVEHPDGNLALFVFRQDGMPENPSLTYNQHKKTLTFIRSPEQVHQIELVKEEAIQTIEQQEGQEISIIEVQDDDPDQTLSYTVDLGWS